MKDGKSQTKVFELEEANALVPALETILAELEEKRRAFERHHDVLFFEELLEEISPPESELQELEGILLSLEEQVRKINQFGCVLRHLGRGDVDFLGRRGKDWIFYCWRRGEKEVRYYHTLRGGFFERQRLNG